MNQLSVLVWKEIRNQLVGLKRGANLPIYSTKSRTACTLRVAVSYLGATRDSFHTNSQQQSDIVRLFQARGACVDLFNNGDTLFLPKRDYHIVFGFGPAWRKLCRENKSSLKILYATEAPPFSFLINESRAERGISPRRNPIRRTYRFYKDEDYANADHIFQMGRLNIASLLSSTLIPSSAISYIATYGINTAEPYSRINSSPFSFLWFGSPGAILKGLAVSMQAIAQVADAKLYVAGCTPKEFECIPTKSSRIHFLGKLRIPSPQFQQVVSECSYVLLPTGAEGISTGVITCMYQGLIPIVTRMANIEQGVLILEDAELSTVRHAIEAAINTETSELRRLSMESRKAAFSLYTREMFLSSFELALNRAITSL